MRKNSPAPFRSTPPRLETEAPSANESAETTHFSVIDGAGNIVSNTYTLNGFYGSQVIAKGTGVLLNPTLGDVA